MTLHTTDDVVTEVTRYLEATRRLLPFRRAMTPEYERFATATHRVVRDTVEALESEQLALPGWITLEKHNRMLDDRVQDAIRNLPQDDYDRGYNAALDDIALLAPDESTQTPAA